MKADFPTQVQTQPQQHLICQLQHNLDPSPRIERIIFPGLWPTNYWRKPDRTKEMLVLTKQFVAETHCKLFYLLSAKTWNTLPQQNVALKVVRALCCLKNHRWKSTIGTSRNHNDSQANWIMCLLFLEIFVNKELNPLSSNENENAVIRGLTYYCVFVFIWRQRVSICNKAARVFIVSEVLLIQCVVFERT